MRMAGRDSALVVRPVMATLHTRGARGIGGRVTPMPLHFPILPGALALLGKSVCAHLRGINPVGAAPWQALLDVRHESNGRNRPPWSSDRSTLRLARRMHQSIAMSSTESVLADLAAFGRVDEHRGRIRLIDAVEDALRWVRGSTSPTASVQGENLDAPFVVASIGQMSQVIVNLVTNAAKSIPDGRVTFRRLASLRRRERGWGRTRILGFCRVHQPFLM